VAHEFGEPLVVGTSSPSILHVNMRLWRRPIARRDPGYRILGDGGPFASVGENFDAPRAPGKVSTPLPATTGMLSRPRAPTLFPAPVSGSEASGAPSSD
jgi:hypothetical protein